MRAFVAACWLLTGCFYTDPIVEPPEISVMRVSKEVHRGGSIVLKAMFTNRTEEQNRLGKYDWEVFLCPDYDGQHGQNCDEESLATGDQQDLSETVLPMTRSTPPRLVEAVRVKLDARDSGGAPVSQVEYYQAADAFPVLTPAPAHPISVGEPIDLFADYSDPDDDLDALVVDELKVKAPDATPPPSYDLEPAPVPPRDPPDPARRTIGKRLTPHGQGQWRATFVVHDPHGLSTERTLDITVTPDQPPCLAQWEPAVPPMNATVPITEPTVFQVPLVEDDLDSYPRSSSLEQFGTTKFAWSILPPGASTRQVLAGATGNRIDIDPAGYTPGDLLEVRVEIADRNKTTLPCGDADATCSIMSTPNCLQRQTWRVEIR